MPASYAMSTLTFCRIRPSDGRTFEATSVRSELLRGAALSYFGIALAVVSGLVVTPLLVRHLGRGDYALFTLSISVVTLLTFDLGLNSAVARFVATFEAGKDRQATLEALGVIRRVYAALDLGLVAVLSAVWLSADRLFPALSADELGRFRIAFAIAGILMVVNFPLQPANGTLQGLGRFVALRGSDVAWRFASIVVTLVAVMADLGIDWLVFGTALSSLAISAYRAFACLRSGVWQWRYPAASAPIRRDIARYTSWSVVVALGQRLMITVMPAILAAMAGTHDVAGFAIAAMFEGYVWLIANAVNGLFLPRVARLVLEQDTGAIQLLMIRVGRFQVMVLAFFIGAFIAFGPTFLRLWLGQGFDDVYAVCVVLIVPSLLIYSQEVAMSVVIARGEIRFRALCTAIAAVVNLALAAVLAPHLGALGAAISVATGSVAGYIIAMNIVYAKAMGLDILAFFRQVHMRMLLMPAVLVGLFIALGHYWRWTSVAHLGLAILTFTSLYALGMWKWVLNSDETEFIGTFSRRFARNGASKS